MRHVGTGTDQGTSSGVGLIADDPDAAIAAGYVGPSLGELGTSFEGCVGVLNIGHWKTMAATITNHTLNSSTFNYFNPDCGTVRRDMLLICHRNSHHHLYPCLFLPSSRLTL